MYTERARANQIFKSNFPPLVNPPWRTPSAVVRPAGRAAVFNRKRFDVGLRIHLYFSKVRNGTKISSYVARCMQSSSPDEDHGPVLGVGDVVLAGVPRLLPLDGGRDDGGEAALALR